jgi:hypothetical protein
VHAVEEFQQRAVAHHRRVKGDLKGLSICSSTKSASHFIIPRDSKINCPLTPCISRTNSPIIRRRRVSSAISNLCIEQALALPEFLAEEMLNTPKTPCGEGRRLCGRACHIARYRFRCV